VPNGCMMVTTTVAGKPTVQDATSLGDEEVIARVLAGETPLFELILRRYNARLFRIARAILRNDAEAEDAVQEAYLSAYQHLGQFHGDARFSTWLTRIAIRAAMGRVRVRSRRAEVDLADEAKEEIMSRAGAHIEDPEASAGRRELTALVEEAIDQLPEIYRVVVMLREVQQLSTGEAADCLEVSEEVVKIRLHRAKAILREAMASKVDRVAVEAFAFLGPRCDRMVERVMTALSRGEK
jgi:RNA polymerase sigma-70 factor, ECF subfamily